MTRTFMHLAVIACGLALTGAGFAQTLEQHPRLFITPERLATIRQQIAVPGSHHQLAFADMKARVENPDLLAAYGENGSYRQGYRAAEAAFMSAIVEAPAEKRKYADIAYQMIDTWKDSGSATLGKSMESRCTALAYDWAYPVWTEAQRQAMRKRVDADLAALGKITHGNLGGDRSSNFVGVIRGSELLLQLASGADLGSDRVKFLIGELRRHMSSAFGSLGATQEGPGYTEYPGGFLLPAVLATKELGDATLFNEAMKHASWKLAMYTRTFLPTYNKSLMWGVGGGGNYNEGWSSLLLPLCPADQLPYYLWWYDRHIGRLATSKPLSRFDGDRHATVWAMLYYPANITAKDPTGVYPPAVADSRGYLFFRNRWQDGDDIVAMLSAQTKKDEKGWNQPEELAINLMGYSTRFIGGPSKSTTPNVFSSLLVDGKYTYKDATAKMGKVVAFEPSKTGGYAIAQGGQMFEVQGIKEVTRHMLVDFQPAGNQAIISTLDRIQGAGEHTYTWQANVGPAEAPGGATEQVSGQPIDAADNVKVAFGTESGCPVFTMQGRHNSYVKGWVLTPGATFGAGKDPLQINTRATDTDLWVVMLVGQGTPPQATITGAGLQSTLAIAGKQVRFDAATGRIVCQ